MALNLIELIGQAANETNKNEMKESRILFLYLNTFQCHCRSFTESLAFQKNKEYEQEKKQKIFTFNFVLFCTDTFIVFDNHNESFISIRLHLTIIMAR